MREAFVETTTALLAEDPRLSLVLADISADAFVPAARAHPDRVLNVGIREQLMVSVAGGLALTGLRPIVHSYAPFVVERAWEQVKLDIDHQGVDAILATIGSSYDASASGRTHQAPGDVALIDTLDGWTVRVPGHADEVGPLLRAAAGDDSPVYLRMSTETNTRAVDTAADGRLTVVRPGSSGDVAVAVGPTLDAVFAATEGLDVTVAYTHTPRPFDAAGLRSLAGATPAVAIVEPYLAGTSARVVADALRMRPHRLAALGVGRADLHRYGTPADHARAHGLDPAGLRRSLSAFFRP
ncbi:transketolase [Luedemannella helvata]|uniref:Transketolase n=1 Tax=Luedemannella helvata TaxID=349315 RepID=A0ABN2JX26_9ACTN